MGRVSKDVYTPGTFINGNLIKEVIDHIVYFECGLCGNPFERTKGKLKWYKPQSCGCAIRRTHDRVIGRCFLKYRKTLKHQNEDQEKEGTDT